MELVENIFNVFTFGLVGYDNFIALTTPSAIITLLSYGFVWFLLFKFWGLIFK